MWDTSEFGRGARIRLWPLLLLCPLLLTPFMALAALLSVGLLAAALLGVFIAASKGPERAGRILKVTSHIVGALALVLVALLPSTLAPGSREGPAKLSVSETFRTAIAAKIANQGTDPRAWGTDSAEGPLRVLGETGDGWYLVSVSGELACVHPAEPTSFAPECPNEENLAQL